MLHNKKEQATGLQVFDNIEEGVSIRTQVINKEPWFVARDVCRSLGITWTGHTLDLVPDNWKGLVSYATPGGNQRLMAISEAGLYKLAFRCNPSEQVDRFVNWVAGEVLPTLRKTGKYELKGRRVLPRDRGEDLRAFYDELTRWVTHKDERLIAEIQGVGVKHVNDVLRGRRPGYAVLQLLVEQAKENRRRGIMRMIVTQHRNEEVRELMLNFSED